MAQADKNYGSALYARILVYMKDVGQAQDVRQVCRAMFGEAPNRTHRKRVLNVLNNLYRSEQLHRELVPTQQKSVNKYHFTYRDEP